MSLPVYPPYTLPPDELARQQALERYAILDTDPEFAFDDLTRLAAIVCQTPISLIGLMDNDRQWIKARVGLPSDMTEVPREQTFCNWVVTNGMPLEVRDLRLDPRFADHPQLDSALAPRFYAGVPLKTADNHTVGTVCVVDTKPRELTNAQRQALHTIAEQVMAQLELKVRNRGPVFDHDHPTRAYQRLDQFTGMVAHDLKAPLASLLSIADLMLSDARHGDADAVIEALTVMSGEVGRMQGLVSGLLDYARATRPTTAATLIDVGALLTELRETLPGAANFEFDLNVQVPVVRTAVAPLRQVLHNLLLNAIRHHPAGEGRIEVDVNQGLGNKSIEFRISDDGTGIPPADRDRVFQIFQRLYSPGTGPAGIGIGLATARHLIEDFGGTISIEDGPSGRGTTVEFTWQTAPESAN